jgi:acyl transferase domain-containing protein/NADP-dependent 3-hydroxy acid dehydrogenase YdfG/acyl carrier protein
MEPIDYSHTVSIIGMAGKFPGANNIEEFWMNLRNGVESIKFFSDGELQELGVPLSMVENPKYVKARGIVEGTEYFDAEFFGYPRHVAENMDPQHRLLLETVWHALESSGYFSEEQAGVVSVFASVDQMDSYLWEVLNRNGKADSPIENYQRFIENAPDFIASRISYAFNFTGPSLNVQSACSTGLLSVSLACESLLAETCDMAISGTVNITSPKGAGYLYMEGMISSPDGHCRPFDSRAQGTLLSEGVAAVVLKRTEDAIRDGDHILAVIRGFGVNNDGSGKVGYTAPSVEGQMNVIIEAMAFADIDPETIGYIEAHGTGTKLGDPIEIKAITQAYRALGSKKNKYCPIGAVKGNIGHTDVVAGTAGLIKTILTLKHREIPPTINFEKPNSEIDFSNSPFYLSDKLIPWEKKDSPRRAGVSSFGVGGTNTHIVLEEAPVPKVKSDKKERPLHLLALSANSQKSLEDLIQIYHKFLETTKDALPDICYTANTGRKHFQFRTYVIACNIQEMQLKLKKHEFTISQISKDKKNIKVDVEPQTDWNVLLKDLGESYLLGAHIDWKGLDTTYIRHKVNLPLYPFQQQKFPIQMAVISGEKNTIHPLLGEMHSHPNGSISFFGKFNLSAVQYVKDHVVFGCPILPGTGFIDLMIATTVYVFKSQNIRLSNVSFESALSFNPDKIVDMQLFMTPFEKGYEVAVYTLREDQSWNCHARAVANLRVGNDKAANFDIESIKDKNKKILEKDEFYKNINTTGISFGSLYQSLEKLYVSDRNILGELKLAVPSKGYLTHPALLDGSLTDGASPLSRKSLPPDEVQSIYLPVGCDIVDFYSPLTDHVFAHAQENELTDTSRSINTKIYSPSGKLLVSMEGFRFRKTTAASLKQALAQEAHSEDWMYEWTWQEHPIKDVKLPQPLGNWLVFTDGKVSDLVVDLFQQNRGVCRTINVSSQPQTKDGFVALLKEQPISGILHLSSSHEVMNDIKEAQNTITKSILLLTQALIEMADTLHVPVFLISSDNLFNGPLEGFFKTVLMEHPEINIKYIRLGIKWDAPLLLKTIFVNDDESMIFLNEDKCFVPRLVKMKSILPKETLKLNGNATYLVTGGLGGLGFALSKWLCERGAKKLVLTGRRELTPNGKIKLEELNQTGAFATYEVVDSSKENEIAALLTKLQGSESPLKGIFHLAGVIDDATLAEQNWDHYEKVFSAKVYGSYYLHKYSKDLDLFVMFSSIASTLGSPGQSNYAAANAFMDRLSSYRKEIGLPSHSISWGAWSEAGMAKSLSGRLAKGGIIGMKLADGLDALEIVLSLTCSNLIVANINWKNYFKQNAAVPTWIQGFSQKNVSSDNLPSRLASANTEDRILILKEFLIGIIRDILGISSSESIDEKKGFFEMGLDSLMAVEFKNRIQEAIGDTHRLRSTIVFDFSSLSKMTEYLAEVLGIKVESITVTEVISEKDKEIEDLSEEEAIRKLKEELGYE